MSLICINLQQSKHSTLMIIWYSDSWGTYPIVVYFIRKPLSYRLSFSLTFPDLKEISLTF